MTKEEPTPEHLKSIINDLILVIEMYIHGYSFDENHIFKQKRLIEYSSLLIGRPRTIKELEKMVIFNEPQLCVNEILETIKEKITSEKDLSISQIISIIDNQKI